MIYKPLWVVLEVTDKCNLRCRHCSNSKTTTHKELSFLQRQQIIVDLKLNGCLHITLSGGEPLLDEDIYKLIRLCKKHNIETTITSNGVLIDRFVVRRLAECEIDGVQISVEGLQNEHEFLRGKGTFAKAVNAIKLLNAEGIQCSTMTVVSSLNKSILHSLVEYLNGLAVRYMSFERLTPVGKGRQLKNLLLSAAEIKETFHQLYNLSKSYPIKINDPLKILVEPLLQEYSRNKHSICGGCLIGIATCTISANGDLKLCSRTHYTLGNLLSSDFQALWRKDAVVQRLRSRDTNVKCMKCLYRFACGGCRAEAESATKDIFGDDPGCWANTRH